MTDGSDFPLLALESGGLRFSAALESGGKIFFRASDSDSPEHSRLALPLVRAALAEAKIALADCGGFAFGAGPGRFSGLRMSCAFAQSFAYATGAKLISVPSLAALAEMNFGASEDNALAALPAHRGHAYLAACWRDANGIWRAENPRLVCEDDFSQDDFSENDFPQGDSSSPDGTKKIGTKKKLCGEGWLARPKLRACFPAWETGEFANPDAGAILRLARRMISQGESISPTEAAPIYAREKIALTKAERLAGKMG